MVMVRCLPRLDRIPDTLAGVNRGTLPGQQKFECIRLQQPSVPKQTTITRKIFSSITTTQPSIDDLSKRTAALHIRPSLHEPSSELSDNSIDTTAATTQSASAEQVSPTFPFSPPQPSPMSPKLLSGLADVLPYSRFHESIKQEGPRMQIRERLCPHSQVFCFDNGCASNQTLCSLHPSKDVPRSKISQGRELTYQRSESCTYPSSSSGVCPPSASSPVPFARKATDVKRRSLAINIKVVALLLYCY